jgi:hypothetical protein
MCLMILRVSSFETERMESVTFCGCSLWLFILSKMLMRFAYMKLVIDTIIDNVMKQNSGSCIILKNGGS